MELTQKIFDQYKEEFALKRCELIPINILNSPFYFLITKGRVSCHRTGSIFSSDRYLSSKAIIKILRLTGSRNG